MKSNNMPMPMPSAKDQDLIDEGSKDSSSSLDLNPPSHFDDEDESFKKPNLKNIDNDIVSNVSAPVERLNGIDVVALRDGFYNQRRIPEGMQFKIKNFDDIGDWMKCVNPVLEKKNLEYHKLKKAKK